MHLNSRSSLAATSPARALLLALPLHVPVVALMGLFAGGPWLMASVLSLVVCAVAGLDYRMRGEAAATTIALAFICQPAILVGTLTGHPWQVDMHMYFFAVMAALSFLNSVVPLIVAAGFVAVHHLSLNFALPSMIYPGGPDLGRTLLHAVILVFETAALVAVVLFRQRQQTDLAAQTDAAAESASSAEAAREAAVSVEARANEHRSEMMKILRTEFGSVVESAGEGNFSKRIAANMEDADLARLVSSTNALMDTVDNGISATRAAIEGLAGHDLRARMDGTFHGDFADLQRGVNQTVDFLSDIVADLVDQNSDLHGLSETLSDDATDLLTRVQAQISALEEAGDLNGQLLETAKANVNAAEDAAGSSRHAAQRTDEISATIRSGSEAMGQISKGTEQMASIVGVIESIAMQTNLLALNAAVEAARAGEAGKGFAVVANEVRDLAQRATTASNEIKELIQSNEERVKRGVSLIDSADGQLGDIVEAVKTIQDVMDRIHKTSEDQMSGIDRSRDGLSRIRTAVEASLSTADRNREQAGQVSQKAGSMLSALGQFTLPANAGAQKAGNLPQKSSAAA